MSGSFSCSIEVPAPPETVFGYVVDPTLMLTWIGDHAVLDATPGGEFTLDIQGIPVRGRFVEVVVPERVVFSWGHAGSETIPPGSTRVEFTLAPTDRGGTMVEIEHRDLPDEHLPSHRAGWPMVADRLAAAAGSARHRRTAPRRQVGSGPSPGDHAEVINRAPRWNVR